MFASDFRRQAREALSGKWLLAVGTGLVASILGANSSAGGGFNIDVQETVDNYNSIQDTIFSEGFDGFMPFVFGFISLSVFFALVVFIIGSAIELGYCKFNIKLISSSGAEFDDIFSYFKIFGKALWLRILSALYVFLWTLLLVIPGIIASYKYAMAPYIMAEDTSLTASEAISRSKEMMLGNKWRLFCLDISFIGWSLLAALTLGIGSLWLTPYTKAARAAFYIDLRGDNAEEEEQESTDFI